uniref:Uncharacterized protein n=1 Tax=Parascaris univalens TaxID=6257 RepID=A0A915ARH2_PARUN
MQPPIICYLCRCKHSTICRTLCLVYSESKYFSLCWKIRNATMFLIDDGRFWISGDAFQRQ